MIDNSDGGRFELWLGDELAGVAIYRPAEDDVVIVSHVEVAPHLRGHGVSGPFFDEVLDVVRRRGLRVLPTCGWAAGHMRGNPEHHDLLAG